MEKIETLSTLKGRKFLRNIYFELRFVKNLSSLTSLYIAWKVCCFEKNINKYLNNDSVILHPLGFWRGTFLWMEEIVNRYYYASINSFVYLGAAILLLIVGMRRFSKSVSEEMVIGGLIFEAFLLVMMFVVMLFSPNEEIEDEKFNDDSSAEKDELLQEIGEISRDFAAVSVNFENINNTLNTIANQQNELIQQFQAIANKLSDAVSPNPELINQMQDTNQTLKTFTDNLENLNSIVEDIKSEKIEFEVRKELSNILNKSSK